MILGHLLKKHFQSCLTKNTARNFQFDYSVELMISILKFSEPGRFKLKPEMSQTTFSNLRGWLKENLLLVITFSGVFLGVLIGVLLKPLELEPLTISYLAYPGELFMRLLKLMILPLIIASLITGEFKFFRFWRFWRLWLICRFYRFYGYFRFCQ